MLEKLKTEQLIEKPYARKVIPFRFPETERSGREVITIEGLTHGYGDKVGSPLTCVSGRMRSTKAERCSQWRKKPCKRSTDGKMTGQQNEHDMTCRNVPEEQLLGREISMVGDCCVGKGWVPAEPESWHRSMIRGHSTHQFNA